MSAERVNQVRRCKKHNCSRATFVETEEGISVHFRHGKDKHPDVYTIAEMKVYLASNGYVVIKAAHVLKVT